MNGNQTTIYERIGPERIAKAIRLFYDRAFEDPLIQHFFMHSDKEFLITMQTAFATAMLGGPRNYRGKSLLKAHEPFQIRPPHFKRRQVLMAEVLTELAISQEDQQSWLALEEGLRPLVMRQGHESCQISAHLRGQ